MWFSLESRLGLTQLSSWDSRFTLLGDTEPLFLSLQTLQTSQETFSLQSRRAVITLSSCLFCQLTALPRCHQQWFCSIGRSSSGGAQCETYLSLVCNCRRVRACTSCTQGRGTRKWHWAGTFCGSERYHSSIAVVQGLYCFTSFQTNIWKGTPLLQFVMATGCHQKETSHLLFQRPWTFYHPLPSQTRAYIIMQTNKS